MEPSGISLKEFVEKVFLPWSKTEKRSWRNDESRSKPILAYFRNKRMRDITNLNVRAYRKERLASSNGRGGLRAPASVDREVQLLSRIFSLAMERGLLQANPCKGIKLANPGNLVIKYLTVEDEEKLRPHLTAGASPKDIQEIMGHADIGTTMRYVHATDKGKRRTVDAVVRVAERAKGGGNVAEVKRAAGQAARKLLNL